MKFYENNLPCLNKDVKDFLDILIEGKDYSEDSLNEFFEKFGTHAGISAKYGG